MSPTPLALSAHGLLNVSLLPADDVFTFIVGDNKYHVSRFFAAFISPIIYSNLLADPLFSSFTIDIPDINHNFQMVIDLMQGKTINASLGDMQYLDLVSRKLGNAELLNMIKSHIEEPFKITNIIEIIQDKFSLGLNISEEINFAAANFTRLSYERLESLDCSILEQILHSKRLLISSESELLAFITRLIEKHGQEYRILLENIVISNLDSDSMKIYVSLFDMDDVTTEMWGHIVKRLCLPVEIIRPTPRNNYEKNIYYKGSIITEY